MSVTTVQIQNALRELIDPITNENFVDGKSAKNIIVDANNVSLEIVLGYPGKSVTETIRQTVIERLKRLDWGEGKAGNISVNVFSKIVSHSVQRGVKLNPNIKNIIAVASGKGGVGKSTTAVNLALALAAEGAVVGMLDADIYGPSQPTMLGITGRPQSKDGKTMEPMEGHGIQAMSVGFLIDQETPMVWRGPMVTQALEQLLNETRWNNLDYLIIDLPPGTGDIQLTLAQKVPVTGAVIVTTPQDIALLDARKGLKMFEKVGVPIIGIVENMSMHTCSNCGHTEHIFGAGGGGRMSKDYSVDLLGSLPLDIRIREMTDSGKPTVVSDPDGATAKIYRDIAHKVAAKIAKQSQDHSHLFPKIVIQNT
ncbi:MAG: iron-sulfur cluster carrier protein ApbC [Pseudomonadota bacterium]